MNALIGIEVGVLRGVDILKKSVEFIGEFSDILVISAVIRTYHQQVYDNDDANLSVVVKVQTSASPDELIHRLTGLEQYFIREYFSKFFKAVLLSYSDFMRLTPPLVLPHPLLIQNKSFLIGAVEIWPHYLHPILGQPMSELIHDVDLKGSEFFGSGKSLLNNASQNS